MWESITKRMLSLVKGCPGVSWRMSNLELELTLLYMSLHVLTMTKLAVTLLESNQYCFSV